MNNKIVLLILITSILITSGIGVAYAANFPGSNTFGTGTVASGDDSTAFGAYSTASGTRSTALGDGATASNTFSIASGWGTTASGIGSTAFGAFTTASGSYSTTFGWGTTANGQYSTTFGKDTTASSSYSAAFGEDTIASNPYSTAFGYFTTASGYGSTAFGYHTTAQPYSSFVIGQYNEISGTVDSWVDTDPLFVIGNGVNSTSLNNALTVLKNGNVGIGVSSPIQPLQVLGIIESTLGGFKFPDGTTQSTASIGDIEGVTAGTGLSGGGTLGSVTLDVDTTIIQNRVTGSCNVGSFISVINSDGTVTCETDGNPWTTSNSNIYYTDGNIGIGTTSPFEKLEVDGNLKLTGNIISDGDICIGKCQ